MTIKIVEPCCVKGIPHEINDTLDLTENEEKDLVRMKRAVYYEDTPKPKPKRTAKK